MSLTQSQATALKAHIDASGDLNVFPNTPDGNIAIAELLNLQASPDFWVWKDISTLQETGMALRLDDVASLTTANSTRIQVAFQVRPGGFNPAEQTDRALFGEVFSVAGASDTRAALLAIWQRLATRVEQVLATGTGTLATGDLGTDGSVSVGSPAVLGFVGNITANEVEFARDNG